MFKNDPVFVCTMCVEVDHPHEQMQSLQKDKNFQCLHAVPEGTWAVSQLCDGSRTSGGASVHLYFLLHRNRQNW